jgi:hypothetical protein
MRPGAPRTFWTAFDVARWPIMGQRPALPLMLGDAIMYIAILAVMLLVFLNTLIVFALFAHGYIRETESGIRLDGTQRAEVQRHRRARVLILTLLGVSLLCVAVWGALSVTGTVFAMGTRLWAWRSPSDQQIAHELWSVGLFVLFLIIDWRLLASVRRELLFWEGVESKAGADAKPELSARCGALRIERQFQMDSIWFVDVPVILGVVALLCTHAFLYEHRWSILACRDGESHISHLLPPDDRDLYLNDYELDGRLPRNDNDTADVTAIAARWPTWAEKISRERQVRRFCGFLQGFSTGGVMMHIAISQFILGVLLLRFFKVRESARGPTRSSIVVRCVSPGGLNPARDGRVKASQWFA